MAKTCTALIRNVLVAAIFAAVAPADAGDKKPDQPAPRKPRYTIGKDTTFVTGPLDKDGYVDFPKALNERLAKGVTAQNNSYVLITKAIGPKPEGAALPAEFYKWLGIAEPPENGDYFVGQRQLIKDHLKIDDGEPTNAMYDLISRCGQRPWTAQQHPQVAAWLTLNEKPLAVVVEATKRSRYFHPLVPGPSEKGPTGLIGALVSGVQKSRDLAQALVCRAMLHLGEGRADAAWQDLQSCHRLGRHVAHGATLIEALVGVALENIAVNADLAYLENAKLTSPQIMARLRELEKLPPMPPMADKVDLGERFMFLDGIKLVEQGGLDYLEGMAGAAAPKKPNPLAQRYWESINWDPALRTANKWYDRMAACMRMKDHDERRNESLRIDNDLKELRAKSVQTGRMISLAIGTAEMKGETLGNILICLMMPAHLKVQQAGDRTEQMQTNLHLAFALAAYQRDQGRYPERLGSLVPKYRAAIPSDLFTGKPLVYRPMDKGYLLYSFGPNGRDDEARWYDDEPPGDDPSVRIPLPPLREKRE